MDFKALSLDIIGCISVRVSCLKLDITMALGYERRNNGIGRKSEAARRNGKERMRVQAGMVVVGVERRIEVRGRRPSRIWVFMYFTQVLSY